MLASKLDLPTSITADLWRTDKRNEMALDRVAGVERHVVAALHHARAPALPEQTLGRDGDVEIGIGLVSMQRRERARAARAENQNVGLEPLEGHMIFQNRRASRMRAMTADSPAAIVASSFWPSRQGRFSITSSRSPPSMCTRRRKTRPLSASLTSG